MKDATSKVVSPDGTTMAQSGVVTAIPLESQGDRRRAQLIKIASTLIERESVDAVTMSRVAELAGCTRTQVHRYFRKRDDLLAAVIHEFNRLVGARAPSLDAFFSGSTPNAAHEIHELIWDAFEEIGIGGLILLSAPHANGLARTENDRLRREMLEPWIGSIRQLTGSKSQAEMVTELWLVTTYRIATMWKDGTLDRKAAIDTLSRIQLAILMEFSNKKTS